MVDEPRRSLSGTWEWDGDSWNALPNATEPLARRGAVMTYDPNRRRIVMFGESIGEERADLWEFDGSTWTEVPIVPPLPRRYAAGFAYDYAHGQYVLFGGRNEPMSGGSTATTVLEYDANVATEACNETIDYDRDGLAGCADPDCWLRCTPTCPPGLTCAPPPPCGNGTCDAIEDCRMCPGDCGLCEGDICGDFQCDLTEPTTCPADC